MATKITVGKKYFKVQQLYSDQAGRRQERVAVLIPVDSREEFLAEVKQQCENTRTLLGIGGL